MSDTAPQLEERTCAKCGATDSEPHHVQYVAFNHPVSGMGVDLSVTKHVQCCAEDGCPVCSTDMRFARETGADTTHLREYLVHRPREVYQELFEKLGIESTDFQYPADSEEQPTNG